MSQKTKIQWCDSTFSPWRGCSKVSEGCKNCYIFGTAPLRVSGQKSGGPRIRASESLWQQVRRWNTKLEAENTQSEPMWDVPGQKWKPRRIKVFPSLCDWLDDEVPIEWLADFLKLIYETPNLDWLLLTKRPENWIKRVCDCCTFDAGLALGSPAWKMIHTWVLDHIAPKNVWIGTSCENQELWNKRRRLLFQIPAAQYFFSLEPLLGPINLHLDSLDAASLQKLWFVAGGESGPHARPCDIGWIGEILAQCNTAGVAAFCKQLGSNPTGTYNLLNKIKDKKGGDMSEWPEDLRVRQMPAQKGLQ